MLIFVDLLVSLMMLRACKLKSVEVNLVAVVEGDRYAQEHQAVEYLMTLTADVETSRLTVAFRDARNIHKQACHVGHQHVRERHQVWFQCVPRVLPKYQTDCRYEHAGSKGCE